MAGYLAADVLSCFDFLVRELRSDFTSAGTLCRGWLYLPEGVTRPPVIVLAHGISLTHSFHYWRRAEAYAAAGFAVFDFDPRFIGCSDGEPRQMGSVRSQREDLVAAVAHVRSLGTVDTSRVVLAGMSLGGGLVIDVAARDHGIAAVVAIVPYLDGTKALRGTPMSCPVLLVSGDADTCTPATSQRPCARGRDNVTIRTGPFKHFDPFSRDSEASIAAGVAFLRLHVSQRNRGRGATKR